MTHPKAMTYFAAALLLPLLLAGCNDNNAPAAVPSTPGWEIRYSTAVTLNAPVSGHEFSFNFPLSPGSVHYITKPVTLAASGAARATFTITTTGDPVFDYHTAADNSCDAPAAVRLFLQQQGDDLSGAGPYEFYRWWSTAGTVLKDGSFTVTVVLNPALWRSVLGKTGDAKPSGSIALNRASKNRCQRRSISVYGCGCIRPRMWGSRSRAASCFLRSCSASHCAITGGGRARRDGTASSALSARARSSCCWISVWAFDGSEGGGAGEIVTCSGVLASSSGSGSWVRLAECFLRPITSQRAGDVEACADLGEAGAGDAVLGP
jgi:hypothetical protein